MSSCRLHVARNQELQLEPGGNELLAGSFDLGESALLRRRPTIRKWYRMTEERDCSAAVYRSEV
ncbi:MAG: hypothetical protein ACR2QO_07985 [Acidimicrobiales bacterium]